MIRSDYLLRLIEQLGTALRTLLGVRSSVVLEVENLQGSIETACERGLGLHYSTIRAMPPDELVALFKSGGGTWLDRCYLAANLDQCDAELSQRRGNPTRATESAQRALYLYGILLSDPTTPPGYDIQSKIGPLLKILSDTGGSRGRRSQN